MRTTGKGRARRLAMVVPLLISGASAGHASDEEVIEAGRADFERHCAVCHGVDATGTGPLTEYLIRKPADLTTIAQNYEGRFPFDRVAAVIDGRADVAAHGPREMPVWGYRFVATADRDEAGQTAEQRITAIATYLETLQKR